MHLFFFIYIYIFYLFRFFRLFRLFHIFIMEEVESIPHLDMDDTEEQEKEKPPNVAFNHHYSFYNDFETKYNQSNSPVLSLVDSDSLPSSIRHGSSFSSVESSSSSSSSSPLNLSRSEGPAEWYAANEPISVHTKKHIHGHENKKDNNNKNKNKNKNKKYTVDLLEKHAFQYYDEDCTSTTVLKEDVLPLFFEAQHLVWKIAELRFLQQQNLIWAAMVSILLVLTIGHPFFLTSWPTIVPLHAAVLLLLFFQKRWFVGGGGGSGEGVVSSSLMKSLSMIQPSVAAYAISAHIFSTTTSHSSLSSLSSSSSSSSCFPSSLLSSSCPNASVVLAHTSIFLVFEKAEHQRRVVIQRLCDVKNEIQTILQRWKKKQRKSSSERSPPQTEDHVTVWRSGENLSQFINGKKKEHHRLNHLMDIKESFKRELVAHNTLYRAIHHLLSLEISILSSAAASADPSSNWFGLGFCFGCNRRHCSTAPTSSSSSLSPLLHDAIYLYSPILREILFNLYPDLRNALKSFHRG